MCVLCLYEHTFLGSSFMYRLFIAPPPFLIAQGDAFFFSVSLIFYFFKHASYPIILILFWNNMHRYQRPTLVQLAFLQYFFFAFIIHECIIISDAAVKSHHATPTALRRWSHIILQLGERFWANALTSCLLSFEDLVDLAHPTTWILVDLSIWISSIERLPTF